MKPNDYSIASVKTICKQVQSHQLSTVNTEFGDIKLIHFICPPIVAKKFTN